MYSVPVRSPFGLTIAMALIVSMPAPAQGPRNQQPVPIDPAAAALFRLATRLQNQSDFTAAEQKWRTFLQEFPNDPVVPYVQHSLGICLMQRDQLAEAVEHLQASVEAPQRSFRHRDEALMNLGWTLYNLGMRGQTDGFQRAAGIFEQLRGESAGKDSADQALFCEADCRTHLGEIDRAITLYEQLLRDYPKSPRRADALYALTVAYQETGNLAAALASCETFFQQFPGHALANDISVRHAEVLFLEKQFQQAKDAFEKVAQAPGFELADYVQMRIGACWEAMEEPLAAAKHYTAIVEDNPTSPFASAAALSAARNYYRARQYSAALASYETFLATDPPEQLVPDAWYVKALCEIGLGQTEAAFQSLSSIREQFPAYVQGDRVLYELAWLHIPNAPEKALTVFAELATRHPTSMFRSEALVHLADAEFVAKRLDQAEQYYRQAIDTATSAEVIETAMYKLAYLYFRDKRYSDARTLLHDQLQSYPGGTLAMEATFLTAECWFAEKEFSRAADLYQQVRPAEMESPWSRELVHLHAGQALILSGKYDTAIEWLDPLFRQDPPSELKWKSRLAIGEALRHLRRWDEARAAYSDVANGDHGALGARAHSMLESLPTDS